MANSLKLVIFDCDGTLVDSQHVIVAAMHEAYRGHRVPVPARERLLSIVGLSLAEAFRALGEGHSDYPVTTLIERYRIRDGDGARGRCRRRRGRLGLSSARGAACGGRGCGHRAISRAAAHSR